MAQNHWKVFTFGSRMLQKCAREQQYPPPWRQTTGRCSLLEWKWSKSLGRYCESDGNEVSEIKVSDQRGRRLSGRRFVDFTKQKCGREVQIPPAWRPTIGRCSLLECKCCKSVAGTQDTHHHGAKPLEGVHFWSGNVANVWKGVAVPARWCKSIGRCLLLEWK